MLASSRKPCHAANPRRRAKSPALHCGRDRAAADERPLPIKPAGGPMKSSAPAKGHAAACHLWRCCPPALHCRAGVYARRGALRQPGRILAGQGTAPLSRLTPPAPLTGEPSGWQVLYKASPARGCGVERRLRRRKRDGAGAAVAERKCASAHAARCGHRKPDGGCAVRRRRRGALPLCPTGILQSPARPCPMFRRGRCLHRPGNLAMPQVPGGGRNRPPYIAAGAWRQRINASLLPGPPAGR